MLTKVEVDDMQGHTLQLPLENNDSGYLVTDITGLDPVNATISSSAFAQLDGSQAQGARRENRNIVMQIKLEPYFGDSSVRTLRDGLYPYFMPKTFVRLKFFDDNVPTVTIVGQVETMETPLFSVDPAVSISIVCFDPSFQALVSTRVNGNTTAGSTEQKIVYPGSIETGYLFTLNVNRDMASGFAIYNRRPDGTVALMDVSINLDPGDKVEISTRTRDKYAKLTRSGTPSSILYAVSKTAKWAPLYPGDNFYRVLASGVSVPFTIDYTSKYGGL